ncbi:MAG TPA: exo-beta-N-acetylmuramidase NamZ domain-containing protein, partial [Flavobacteriaceae bacterium]|nr:exo-beta-N-acetylmuramidase NamZ domain-containing protein [Flavobacteriaceae bacterium]
MIYTCLKNTLILIATISFSCGNGSTTSRPAQQVAEKLSEPLVGANQTEKYLPLLKGKKVAILGNQTSVIFKNPREKESSSNSYSHLVDSLLSLGINITKVFSPEHGFRGEASAGEIVKDGIDLETGLPIISLYGNNKKPSADQLENVEILV